MKKEVKDVKSRFKLGKLFSKKDKVEKALEKTETSATETKEHTKVKSEDKKPKDKELANLKKKKFKDLMANVDLQKYFLPSDLVADKKEAIDEYGFVANSIPVKITIYKTVKEFVPVYDVSISSISETTEIILEKIRKELISQVTLGIVEITDTKKTNVIEEKIKSVIEVLVMKYFPDADDNARSFLSSYLAQKSLGMGNIEILVADNYLEEIAINSVHEPVWVYHKKHGWLKTNIQLASEEQTRHFATMIGRKVGRQISSLSPLLDAHLNEGDRVNATIMPISTMGNTITMRKFSRDPFTVTKFLKFKTMSFEAASLIWLAMQYELSAIVAGGTASGKTSTLNVLASFLPPNQRIISIEDTRELRLPKFLHWVPMSTRQPNAEGKGSVSMEDLLVNSLRMRPDRILVGEVRRKEEAETLFEAIHTGHSCYATFHANDAYETVNRLIHAPIEVPKSMLPAISMIIMQFRNRRTGMRRTFQIAEITEDSTPNVLKQYDPKKDMLTNKNKSKSLLDTLKLFTGYSQKEIDKIIESKMKVLKYLVKNEIDSVDNVGRVMAEYYTNHDQLMKYVNSNKNFIKSIQKAPKGAKGTSKIKIVSPSKVKSKKHKISKAKVKSKKHKISKKHKPAKAKKRKPAKTKPSKKHKPKAGSKRSTKKKAKPSRRKSSKRR